MYIFFYKLQIIFLIKTEFIHVTIKNFRNEQIVTILQTNSNILNFRKVYLVFIDSSRLLFTQGYLLSKDNLVFKHCKKLRIYR